MSHSRILHYFTAERITEQSMVLRVLRVAVPAPAIIAPCAFHLIS